VPRVALTRPKRRLTHVEPSTQLNAAIYKISKYPDEAAESIGDAKGEY